MLGANLTPIEVNHKAAILELQHGLSDRVLELRAPVQVLEIEHKRAS